MAVTRHQVTPQQLVNAWMEGGDAFESLVLGIPAIAATPFGQYCRRRGGLPGKVGQFGGLGWSGDWSVDGRVGSWIQGSRANRASLMPWRVRASLLLLAFPFITPHNTNTNTKQRQAASVRPGEPDMDEHLPPIPGT